jgi:4-amino-4-deoxy-L-arabinose transferase-like glycosyltransferase
LSNFPHFYDGPEYISLSKENSLTLALSKSHEVAHPVYIFLIQVSQKLFHNISLVSALFGILGMISFYILTRRLFGKKIAFLSLAPITFFPHLYLIQTNIMHEAVDHFLLITSILFFDTFLVGRKFINIFISLVFLSLAFINFPGNLVWISLFPGLYVFRRKK